MGSTVKQGEDCIQTQWCLQSLPRLTMEINLVYNKGSHIRSKVTRLASQNNTKITQAIILAHPANLLQKAESGTDSLNRHFDLQSVLLQETSQLVYSFKSGS